jgi:hypothetical protein
MFTHRTKFHAFKLSNIPFAAAFRAAPGIFSIAANCNLTR